MANVGGNKMKMFGLGQSTMMEDEKNSFPVPMSAAPSVACSAAILRDRRGIRALKPEHGCEELAHGQRE